MLRGLIRFEKKGISVLDKEVKTFYGKRASEKHLDLGKIINTILRKEMEILKEVGA